MPRKSVIVLILVLAFEAEIAEGADRQKIAKLNVAAQAIVTTVSRAIHGNFSARDLAQAFAVGGIAGYGFYEAKSLAGRGRVTSGWIVANAAASVTQNTVAGKNPLAQIGYSVGPIRFRIPIPAFDRSADSYVLVDASEYESIRLYEAHHHNDRMGFRNGMVAFKRDTIYATNPHTITVGSTWGMFPGVWVRADKATWNHEVIHAMQSLQGDSAEPHLPFLTYTPSDHRKRVIRFEHFDIGILNMANDRLTGRQQYQDQWTEIEAYRLAQQKEPNVP